MNPAHDDPPAAPDQTAAHHPLDGNAVNDLPPIVDVSTMLNTFGEIDHLNIVNPMDPLNEHSAPTDVEQSNPNIDTISNDTHLKNSLEALPEKAVPYDLVVAETSELTEEPPSESVTNAVDISSPFLIDNAAVEISEFTNIDNVNNESSEVQVSASPATDEAIETVLESCEDQLQMEDTPEEINYTQNEEQVQECTGEDQNDQEETLADEKKDDEQGLDELQNEEVKEDAQDDEEKEEAENIEEQEEAQKDYEEKEEAENIEEQEEAQKDEEHGETLRDDELKVAQNEDVRENTQIEKFEETQKHDEQEEVPEDCSQDEEELKEGNELKLEGEQESDKNQAELGTSIVGEESNMLIDETLALSETTRTIRGDCILAARELVACFVWVCACQCSFVFANGTYAASFFPGAKPFTLWLTIFLGLMTVWESCGLGFGSTLNPSVSVAMFLAGQGGEGCRQKRELFVSLMAQLVAHAIGIWVSRLALGGPATASLFAPPMPDVEFLVGKNSTSTLVAASVVEGLATCAMCMVILWVGRKMKSAPVTKSALTIAIILLLVGALANVTGASMNPFMHLGLALWEGNWRFHSAYWVGPILGASVAAAVHNFLVHGTVKYQPVTTMSSPTVHLKAE